MECDKAIFINSDNVRLQNMKILSYEKEEAIRICSGCSLKAVDCTFESGSNIISRTLIWVMSEAVVIVNNCQFREAEAALAISPIARHVDIRICHFASIKVGQLPFGCVIILDEDEGIEGMVGNGYFPLYVTLKCVGNVFEEIDGNYPFIEEWNSDNKTYSIHEKDCYTIKDNVVIDERDADANKLYQVRANN